MSSSRWWPAGADGHARYQQGEGGKVARLRHVGERAQLAGARRVDGRRLGANEDERDPARSLVAAQRLGKLKAVESAHRDVGQHEIRTFRTRLLEPALAVCCLQYDQTLDLQVDRAERPTRRVVVDDQNA